jgi:prolyl oligopeptidase
MFDPSLIAWLELGGAYVVANLRGGGEYGREWHEAGTLAAKQNVFDDFISVGEWLCAEGLTRPGRLAIHGRSNGGLLVGAALVQRPDLFGAAVPAVGVLDMLRYHRFTIGWAWASDYGTADDPDQFEVLFAYSPLHNAHPGTYPPTLVLTGDHDDRVVPAHSYKFAAALQHAQQGDAPVLLRVDTRAGHGMGKAVSMVLDERTDMFAFLAHHLGLALSAG